MIYKNISIFLFICNLISVEYLVGAFDCHSTCLTCTGPNFDNCISCKSGLVKMATGACACPEHFYIDVSTYNCIECHQTC